MSRELLVLLGDWPEWHDDAVCNQTDPEAFFPEKGESPKNAKAICGECPVRAECLADAVDRHEQFGIWGGLSFKERRLLWTRKAAA